MTVKNTDYNSRIKRNIELYKSGKSNLTAKELYELKIYLLKFKDIVSTTEFFVGLLKDYRIVSCFAEDFYFELQDYMIKKYKADIAVTVIIKDRKIFLKSNKERCKVDLCILAKLLCGGACIDESGSIAEGNITEKFLTLTKSFKPCI